MHYDMNNDAKINQQKLTKDIWSDWEQNQLINGTRGFWWGFLVLSRKFGIRAPG